MIFHTSTRYTAINSLLTTTYLLLVHCHMQHGIAMCYSYTHTMQAEVGGVYSARCVQSEVPPTQDQLTGRRFLGGSYISHRLHVKRNRRVKHIPVHHIVVSFITDIHHAGIRLTCFDRFAGGSEEESCFCCSCKL